MPEILVDFRSVIGGEVSTEGRGRYSKVGNGYFDPAEGVPKITDATSIGSASRFLLLHPARSQAEAEYAALKNQLKEQYKRIVSNARPTNDEIIVPTNSLYIEALPGAHPLLEDFKLVHRAIDVKKVQAEVRKLEMENVRYAARILSGEREDPDIERKIVISGNGEAIVVPPVEN